MAEPKAYFLTLSKSPEKKLHARAYAFGIEYWAVYFPTLAECY